MSSSPPDRSDAGFTGDDARELSRLLAKYATHRLDQFDLWKLEFKWGSVYVDIARRPFQGASEVAYTRIWPLTPHHPTGAARARAKIGSAKTGSQNGRDPS